MTRELKPEDFFPPDQDRRSEPRLSPDSPRVIQLLPCRASKDWKFITADVIDCSLHGLGILLDEPLEVGHQFLVKLRTAKHLRMLLYTVQQSTRGPRGRYRRRGRLVSRYLHRQVDGTPGLERIDDRHPQGRGREGRRLAPRPTRSHREGARRAARYDGALDDVHRVIVRVFEVVLARRQLDGGSDLRG